SNRGGLGRGFLTERKDERRCGGRYYSRNRSLLHNRPPLGRRKSEALHITLTQTDDFPIVDRFRIEFGAQQVEQRVLSDHAARPVHIHWMGFCIALVGDATKRDVDSIFQESPTSIVER